MSQSGRSSQLKRCDTMPDGKNDYMEEFNKFLENKLTHVQEPPVHVRTDLQKSYDIVHHLLHTKIAKQKIPENKSQQRFNRIINQFKSLETFVDTKNFIKDLNLVNQVSSNSKELLRRFPAQLPTQENTLVSGEPELTNVDVNQELLSKIETVYGSYLKNCYLNKHKQIDHILEKAQLEFNQRTHSPQDRFILQEHQDAVYVKTGEQAKDIVTQKHFKDRHSFDCLDFKRMPIQTLKTNSTEHKQQQIDAQYEKKFNHKIQDIECALQKTLQNIHQRKWSKRSKRLDKVSSSLSSLSPKKYVLDIKYKIHAPRGVFEWKGVRKQSPSRLHQIGSSHRRLNSQASSHEKIPLEKQYTNGHSTFHKSRWGKEQLTKEESIRNKYSFKKPAIKQKVLRRLANFMSSVEDKQFELKKDNVELLEEIDKCEETRNVALSRFIDQKIEIEFDCVKTESKILNLK